MQQQKGLERFGRIQTSSHAFDAATQFLKMLYELVSSGKDTFTRKKLTNFLKPSHWQAEELRRLFMTPDAKCSQLVEQYYLHANHKRGLGYKILLHTNALPKPKHSIHDYEFYQYYKLALSISSRKPASRKHIYAIVSWSNMRYYAAAMLKKSEGATNERQKRQFLARREIYLHKAKLAQEEVEKYRKMGEFISANAARRIYCQQKRQTTL